MEQLQRQKYIYLPMRCASKRVEQFVENGQVSPMLHASARTELISLRPNLRPTACLSPPLPNLWLLHFYLEKCSTTLLQPMPR